MPFAVTAERIILQTTALKPCIVLERGFFTCMRPFRQVRISKASPLPLRPAPMVEMYKPQEIVPYPEKEVRVVPNLGFPD